MRVYVAGRTNNVAQVRAVQRIARDEGWEITHDWTQIVEEVSGSAKGADQPSARVPDERKREYAEGDIYGVRNADVVIVVCSPDLTGTLVEVGIAIERATARKAGRACTSRCAGGRPRPPSMLPASSSSRVKSAAYS
jgi:nucleoside 2-deoxyribosyltransferase